MLHIRSCILIFLYILCIAALVAAQEPLNNEGVVKLVKSGMTEDLIINVIQQQPGTYAFGAADLVTLKEAGVTEKIIAAMLAKAKGDAPAGAAGAASRPVATAGQRSTISGPGIFYKKGNEYFELLTEEVEWRTGGAMKNVVSAGIVKKDLKGAVAGPSSRNFLTNPMEIVFSLPAGVSANSFILLPMKPDKGVREFNVGPVNQKSGVAKGAIPFGMEKIGETTLRMVLQTPLSPGEYGILTATPDTNAGSGKMHTFRILL